MKFFLTNVYWNGTVWNVPLFFISNLFRYSIVNQMISLCSKLIMQFRLINPIISEHIMVFFFLITKKNLRAAVVGYKRLTPLLYGYLSKTFSIMKLIKWKKWELKKWIGIKRKTNVFIWLCHLLVKWTMILQFHPKILAYKMWNEKCIQIWRHIIKLVMY